MKNITKEWLKKQSACREGYEWALKRTDVTVKGTINELININRIDWANWTMTRLLNRKQKIQYAIFAAEQVIEIYEKKYPNDKRPRLAIEAAKKVLKSNTKKNRAAATDAAYAASYTAYDAAYAANAAAYAASNAASYTAYAASYTAYDAAYAANAAANAASNAAYDAKKEMQVKILNYGLKLLGVTPC